MRRGLIADGDAEESATVGALCLLGDRLLVGMAPVWGAADIVVLDVASGEVTARLAGHQFAVSSFAAIDEQERFAVRRVTSTVRLWDLSRRIDLPAPLEPRIGHVAFAGLGRCDGDTTERTGLDPIDR